MFLREEVGRSFISHQSDFNSKIIDIRRGCLCLVVSSAHAMQGFTGVDFQSIYISVWINFASHTRVCAQRVKKSSKICEKYHLKFIAHVRSHTKIDVESFARNLSWK
jgi:predicted trehalose synthase